MKSTISYFKILAGASCVLALSACDSVKDVPEKTTGNLPPPTVVLSGQITNLSSLRSITLMNNGDTINTKSFINAAPSAPNQGVRPVPFSFGAIAAGTAYEITVKVQPELKNCVVVNGKGVLTAGVRPDVVINCNNVTGAGGQGGRYDLTVNLPTNANYFKGLADARVRVTTEEEIREVTVNSNTTSVTFSGVLINATGALNGAPWSVTASTFEGARLNKCVVTSASNSAVVAGVTVVTNATGNISGLTAPTVGAVTAGVTIDATLPACQFSVAGKVGYSLPPGASSIPTITGLKLQLRDMQGNSLEEVPVSDCTPATADVITSTQTTTASVAVPVPLNGCSYAFTTPLRSSSTSGLYEVAVSQQPTGQACIVVNGGSVSVFTTGTTPPVSVTNANVFCRATPTTADRRIQGVFRLQSSTWNPNNVAVNTLPATNTSTWKPFDLTAWNTASSNMMGFFNNGTFLYGAHGNGGQVEHGFYDYDAVNKKLRFTLIVDSNTATAFPTTFASIPVIAVGTPFTTVANTSTTTAGLSATPNPIRQNGVQFAAAHAAMTDVTLGTVSDGLNSVDGDTIVSVRTISGTFGADTGTTAATVANVVTTPTPTVCTPTVYCVNPTTLAVFTSGNCTAAPGTPACVTVSPANTNRLNWVLQEVPQVPGEVTGGWLAQDGRRLWVWDYRTYYGTGVGMLGGSPSMNDACFTMEDLHVSSGIYTRRGSATGCYPFSRPANGQTPGYFAGTAESLDFTITALTNLPGYTGRIPGGEPAPGTSSPSPIYFQVAPAGTFFSVANPTYFPTVSTAWCTTEILGMRATANGFPINPPVYFCRTRSSL